MPGTGHLDGMYHPTAKNKAVCTLCVVEMHDNFLGFVSLLFLCSYTIPTFLRQRALYDSDPGDSVSRAGRLSRCCCMVRAVHGDDGVVHIVHEAEKEPHIITGVHS